MKPFNARKQSGFTLMELMIVVAIVGILGAIAYPAYTNSVLKGRRAQARTAITELLQQQERYLTQTNCYMAFTNASGTPSPQTSCASTPASVPFKVFAGDSVSSASYWLTADVCTSGAAATTLSDCVKVTATPVKSDPEVTSLSMTSTGTKSCTPTTTDVKTCWP